ncbi:hypothetical protein [Pyxidicoccus caerfyrddinensis]|jgi:hypothetical protein|uniref:hypothetical protein n=1 Tax=Pyxidicoccus caerfyrddinensis TaxID=2709663 RepID=UPI0013DA51A9|nr:hypothetical protein [Pyxidicoccus caerfyrddinensis]
MKKSLRMLVCLAGGALFGMGCGGAPQETPAEVEQPPAAEQPPMSEEQPGEVHQQAVYSVCWGELGIYQSPSTSSLKVFVLQYGNHFNTDSSVFWANGDYWVRGQLYCYPPYTCTGGYGYVRWDGLCH